MELPDDVVSIIRDYSRPITRPNWRELHRLLPEQLHLHIIFKFNTTFNLALIYFIQTQTSDYTYGMNGGTIITITTPQNRKHYILN